MQRRLSPAFQALCFVGVALQRSLLITIGLAAIFAGLLGLNFSFWGAWLGSLIFYGLYRLLRTAFHRRPGGPGDMAPEVPNDPNSDGPAPVGKRWRFPRVPPSRELAGRAAFPRGDSQSGPGSGSLRA